MKLIPRAAALAGLSLLLLSGCQSAKERALCPSVSILANTSAMTVFKPGMQGDPAGELYTIQMTRAKAGCSADIGEGTVDSDSDITFRATRAPNGDASHYAAPFYVASVLNGTTILNKAMLATTFTFEPGQASITFRENVPSTMIKFENGRKPAEYGLLVGLHLTREQLDYAKNHGRFAP
ncbi:MAG TPA: hypothetical protein VGC36_00650 [Rhizomicrobium sp.]